MNHFLLGATFHDVQNHVGQVTGIPIVPTVIWVGWVGNMAVKAIIIIMAFSVMWANFRIAGLRLNTGWGKLQVPQKLNPESTMQKLHSYVIEKYVLEGHVVTGVIIRFKRLIEIQPLWSWLCHLRIAEHIVNERIPSQRLQQQPGNKLYPSIAFCNHQASFERHLEDRGIWPLPIVGFQWPVALEIKEWLPRRSFLRHGLRWLN